MKKKNNSYSSALETLREFYKLENKNGKKKAIKDVASDVTSNLGLISSVVTRSKVDDKGDDKKEQQPVSYQKNSSLASTLSSSLTTTANALKSINKILNTLSTSGDSVLPSGASLITPKKDEKDSDGKQSYSSVFKSLATNPVTIAAIGGIIYSILPKEAKTYIKSFLGEFNDNLNKSQDGFFSITTALKAAKYYIYSYIGVKLITGLADMYIKLSKLGKMLGASIVKTQKLVSSGYTRINRMGYLGKAVLGSAAVIAGAAAIRSLYDSKQESDNEKSKSTSEIVNDSKSVIDQSSSPLKQAGSNDLEQELKDIQDKLNSMTSGEISGSNVPETWEEDKSKSSSVIEPLSNEPRSVEKKGPTLRDVTPPSKREPVLQPNVYRPPIHGADISSGFGKRIDPFTKKEKMHKGVDYAAVEGTPVYAAADGKVFFAGEKGDYGNLVHIEHPNFESTKYGHLKNIYVSPGQEVKQGEMIGRVGSTGRSTGPHLHFELIKGTRPVDPATMNDMITPMQKDKDKQGVLPVPQGSIGNKINQTSQDVRGGYKPKQQNFSRIDNSKAINNNKGPVDTGPIPSPNADRGSLWGDTKHRTNNAFRDAF